MSETNRANSLTAFTMIGYNWSKIKQLFKKFFILGESSNETLHLLTAKENQAAANSTNGSGF